MVSFSIPTIASAQQGVKVAREAARQLKLELFEHRVGSVEKLRAGLRALRAEVTDAYCATADAMVDSEASLIIDTARAKKLPTMLQEQERVAQGGLASCQSRCFGHTTTPRGGGFHGHPDR